ncbi:MAG: DUF1819 family protein [candidate division Zixibacteria bacterium]|nr:DUF1819 family protein [candidate division Zixibacteria bacterium]
MKKKTTEYNMSFTTGGLLFQESVRVANLYHEIGNWKKVREQVVVQNILQSRTLTTSKKLTGEICSRLEFLNQGELQILAEGNSQEQSHILWLAICRKYKFIREFSVEVIREKFLTLKYELTYSDFDTFFNAKAAWSDELDSITDSTRKKLRQVLFRLLHEIGLLSANNRINPMVLSSRVVNAVDNSSLEDLTVFPVSQKDLKQIGCNK